MSEVARVFDMNNTDGREDINLISTAELSEIHDIAKEDPGMKDLLEQLKIYYILKRPERVNQFDYSTNGWQGGGGGGQGGGSGGGGMYVQDVTAVYKLNQIYSNSSAISKSHLLTISNTGNIYQQLIFSINGNIVQNWSVSPHTNFSIEVMIPNACSFSFDVSNSNYQLVSWLIS
jgi:hypothetical protein